MKSFKLSIVLAAVSLMAGIQSSAMADDKSFGDGDTNWQEHVQSTKTRAEVVAELKQAQQQGLLTISDSDYPGTPDFSGTRSRSEVKNETTQDVKQGNRVTGHNYYGYQ